MGTTTAIVAAYQEGHDWFRDRGIIVKLLKLDNEVSKMLTKIIQYEINLISSENSNYRNL